MPVVVHLAVIDGSPFALLRAYPPLAALAHTQDRLDVTALALREDIYGRTYPAVAPVPAGQRPAAWMPGDLVDDAGRSLADICGSIRTEFFDFVADVGRRTRATIHITYAHERGDFPHEIVQWVFGPRESLHVASFDGHDEPLWERWVERGDALDEAPGPLVHRPFAALSEAGDADPSSHE